MSRAERRSVLAGIPEVTEVARPQTWHPVLEAAAAQPQLKAAAKAASDLTELRSDVFRCLSVALDAMPGSTDGEQGEGVYALLSAASALEIHVNVAVRVVRDQLLKAAQAAPPMEASKYFSAVLAQDDGSAEPLGSELSSLSSVEDMQFTGFLRADSASAGHATGRSRRSRGRGGGSNSSNGQGRGRSPGRAEQAPHGEISAGPRVQSRGRGKGQSPGQGNGAGPEC